MRTIELKSALSDSTAPDTWLPTWTVVTASSVPVAETALTIEPRVTLADVTAGAESLLPGIDTTVTAATVQADERYEDACLVFHVVSCRPALVNGERMAGP